MPTFDDVRRIASGLPGVVAPHYDGYAAVLIRLDAIDDELLSKMITDAWRVRAPKGLPG